MKKEKTVYILYEYYQEYQVDISLKKRIVAIFEPCRNLISKLYKFYQDNNIVGEEIITYSGYDNIERGSLKYTLEKEDII